MLIGNARRFGLGLVCAVAGVLSFATSAKADTIIDPSWIDPEVDLIRHPPANLTPPTMNGGVILNYSALNGFVFVPPGGILEVKNDTGAALTTLTLTMRGTASSADANGVLTSDLTNSGFGMVTITSPSGTDSATSGTAAVHPAGQPDWTWSWTGGTIATNELFEFHFGSFNASDQLTIYTPTAVPLPSAGVAGVALMALLGVGRFALARR